MGKRTDHVWQSGAGSDIAGPVSRGPGMGVMRIALV